MPVPQPRRATVWWLDAHGGSTSECVDHADLVKQHKPTRLGLTGWVVQDDEQGVMIVAEWLPAEGNEHIRTFDYRCPQFRPRCGIERVEYHDPE